MTAIRTLLAAMLATLSGFGALAQTSFPDKPIRILVGFTPGVAPDITARLLADKFAEAWGKPALVENVTGAGGNIATDRVAKAAPDGYTLLMGGNSSLVINPSLYEKLPFDPVRDFAPISQVFVAANILVVHPDSQGGRRHAREGRHGGAAARAQRHGAARGRPRARR
jgi:tripartite-type tricarboxylate transporter receptor subunit TctC